MGKRFLSIFIIFTLMLSVLSFVFNSTTAFADDVLEDEEIVDIDDKPNDKKTSTGPIAEEVVVNPLDDYASKEAFVEYEEIVSNTPKTEKGATSKNEDASYDGYVGDNGGSFSSGIDSEEPVARSARETTGTVTESAKKSEEVDPSTAVRPIRNQISNDATKQTETSSPQSVRTPTVNNPSAALQNAGSSSNANSTSRNVESASQIPSEIKTSSIGSITHAAESESSQIGQTSAPPKTEDINRFRIVLLMIAAIFGIAEVVLIRKARGEL